MKPSGARNWNIVRIHPGLVAAAGIFLSSVIIPNVQQREDLVCLRHRCAAALPWLMLFLVEVDAGGFDVVDERLHVLG